MEPQLWNLWVTRGVSVLPVIQYHWVPEQDTIFHCNCMFKYRNTEIQSYKSKQDCFRIWKHKPLNQGDRRYILLFNNLVEDWRLLLARKCEFVVFVSVSSKIPKHCVFFSTRRGHLAQPRNPKCSEKCSPACFTAKHINSPSLFKLLSSYLWHFTHTTTLFKG